MFYLCSFTPCLGDMNSQSLLLHSIKWEIKCFVRMIIIVSKQTLNTQLRKHSTAFENKTWFKKGMRETLALHIFASFPSSPTQSAPSWAHCLPGVLLLPCRTDPGRGTTNPGAISSSWKDPPLKSQHSGLFDNLFVPLFFKRLQNYKNAFQGRI